MTARFGDEFASVHLFEFDDRLTFFVGRVFEFVGPIAFVGRGSGRVGVRRSGDVGAASVTRFAASRREFFGQREGFASFPERADGRFEVLVIVASTAGAARRIIIGTGLRVVEATIIVAIMGAIVLARFAVRVPEIATRRTTIAVVLIIFVAITVFAIAAVSVTAVLIVSVAIIRAATVVRVTAFLSDIEL